MASKVKRRGLRSWLGLFVLLAIGEGMSLAGSAGTMVALDEEGLLLDLGDTPRCVVLPPQLHVSSDCPGIDVVAVRGQIATSLPADNGQTRALAVVLWTMPSGAAIFMTIVSMPPVSQTQASVRDFLAGVYNSSHPAGSQVTRRDDPRLDHERLAVAGTPAIRYSTETEGGDQILAYLVFGREGAYGLSFAGGSSDEQAALAQRLLSTVTLPAAPVRKPSSSYLLGSLIGAFVITGILSRIIWRKVGRTCTSALIAFGVAGIGSATLGSLTMGIERGLIYIPVAAVWLVIDLIRVPPATEPPPGPPAGGLTRAS